MHGSIGGKLMYWMIIIRQSLYRINASFDLPLTRTHPILTKRGHFIINGAPRIIINQMVRSPGIYFRQSLEKKNIANKSFYADFISYKGTWVRLELDKKDKVWIRMKKVTKLPILLFIQSMGLNVFAFCQFLLRNYRDTSNSLRSRETSFKILQQEKTILNHNISKNDELFIEKIFLLINKLNQLNFKSFLNYINYKNQQTNKSFKTLKIFMNDFDQKKNIVLLDLNFFSNNTLNSLIKMNFQFLKICHHNFESFLIYKLKKKIQQKLIQLKKKKIIQSNIIYKISTNLNFFPYEPKNFKKINGIKDSLTFDHNTSQMFTKDFFFFEKNCFSSIKKLEYSNIFFSQNKAIFLLNELIYPQKIFSELTTQMIRRFLFRRFFNNKNYYLSIIGRIRINNRLGIFQKKNLMSLCPQDFIFAANYLLILSKGFGFFDDIDNLKNRRIRTSGEILQNQFNIGIFRIEKMLHEKLQSSLFFPNGKHNQIFSTKPINGILREFFGSSTLSQFMDQTNPLAEITHKRRFSSLGPGGVNRETAGMQIRGIHPTHYGRICPIETPEGKNAGLVNSITIFSQINYNGFLESPYFPVVRGFFYLLSQIKQILL
eukprot:TRINITY_DN1930_c0_g1_i3.p1 TRINITY_DN1930_c0_g1~~TRINITY_DN1930_c0_g1_i3.p1  ORF type:complete len:601 (-),score=15.33 TRINITY_DN1930_c0_g1_i3:2126-3928(-)